DLDTNVNDFPAVYSRLLYATTELRWDIFEENWKESQWKYPPVVGEAGYVGSTTVWKGVVQGSFFNSSKDDPNDLISMPFRNMARDVAGYYGSYLYWLGRLANGTQISPGTYKMRLAALVPFGTPEHSDNWD